MYFSYKNTEERLYFKNERIKLMLVFPPPKKNHYRDYDGHYRMIMQHSPGRFNILN